MRLTESLWREYEPYIRKLCNYKLNSHREYIDDCVQDVFTALVEAIHKGAKIEYPKAWLTTVANNMIKDIYEQAGHNDKILPFDEKHIDVRLHDSIDYEVLSEQDIEKYLSQIIDYLTKYDSVVLIGESEYPYASDPTLINVNGITIYVIEQNRKGTITFVDDHTEYTIVSSMSYEQAIEFAKTIK